MIKRSLDVMFKRVKCGGMLYVDTISNEEINSKGRKVHFKNSGIDLEGEITHDWKKENKTHLRWRSGKWKKVLRRIFFLSNDSR